jgi:hypothetical protein
MTLILYAGALMTPAATTYEPRDPSQQVHTIIRTTIAQFYVNQAVKHGAERQNVQQGSMTFLQSAADVCHLTSGESGHPLVARGHGSLDTSLQTPQVTELAYDAPADLVDDPSNLRIAGAPCSLRRVDPLTTRRYNNCGLHRSCWLGRLR